MSEPLMFRAAIFDMDGVLTDTARTHAAAWKELIDGYLEVLAERTGLPMVPFDEERDYRRYVDGKPRYEGLRTFLDAREIHLPMGDPADPPERETVCGLANRKDRIFQRVLDEHGVDAFPGVIELVREMRGRGIATAVASSSRNCERIVASAGIADLFGARVDGVTLRELGLSGKPDPDMFVEAARRVGAEPSQSIVFEDAVSGVEAGRRGEFGLVVGVAHDRDSRKGLREAGADLLLDPCGPAPIDVQVLENWFANAGERRPQLLGSWDVFLQELGGARLAVFLDYDGTLAPIVSRPEDAALPDETRAVVRRLADRFPTTLVSGRGREDVAALAGLKNVSYAGSHGFDIQVANGEGHAVSHQVAEEVIPVIDRVSKRLEDELADVEGAIVEPKRFTVAVHYRLVADADLERVEAVIDRVLADHPELRKAHGKRVFELRPSLEWDKGKAVLWLLEALELDRPGIMPIYVGDDVTDEDAFGALEARGVGIVVTLAPRKTAARYMLQDPDEVRDFLERLAER